MNTLDNLQTDKSFTRVNWLDFVRSIAILLVILVHTTEGVYSFNLEAMHGESLKAQFFSFTVFTLGRLGVPLFLFLTGYLILGRKFESTDDVLYFWKRKLLPMVLTFECWTLIFEVFGVFFLKMPFHLADLIQKMLFLKTSHMSHMWYMPMIIGMYLTLPFLSLVVRKFSKKILVITLIVCFLYYFILPDVNRILVAQGFRAMDNKLFLNYTGGYYGLYLVTGYLFRCLFGKSMEKLSSIVWLGFLSVFLLEL